MLHLIVFIHVYFAYFQSQIYAQNDQCAKYDALSNFIEFLARRIFYKIYYMSILRNFSRKREMEIFFFFSERYKLDLDEIAPRFC